MQVSKANVPNWQSVQDISCYRHISRAAAVVHFHATFPITARWNFSAHPNVNTTLGRGDLRIASAFVNDRLRPWLYDARDRVTDFIKVNDDQPVFDHAADAIACLALG